MVHSVCLLTPFSLVVVRTFQGLVDHKLARFHDDPAHDHFVQDLVHLVKVEDEIKLAHAPKVLIKHLHEQVDEFEHA